MSLSAYSQERLLRVVRLLENMEDRNFDLSTWHSTKSCGTTYCAMGLAATTEWFKVRGLLLDDYGRIQFHRLDGSRRYGLDAVSECMGITISQAEYLFMPHHGYTKKEHVIDRICKFVIRDGSRNRRDLQEGEKTRLDQRLAMLDAQMAIEKVSVPSDPMRKERIQKDQPVPALN